MKPTSLLGLTSASRWLAVAGMTVALALSGCGKTGPAGAAGASGTTTQNGITTGTTLTAADNSPGVVVAITSVTGQTGPSGNFQAGDKPVVTFTVKKTNGTAWNLKELASGSILLSGPSFNYQRVLPQASDVITRSVINSDGSFTYTFATGFPATYLPPLNDSAAHGANDGELQGTNLLAGTYTIGLAVRWNYTVDGKAFADNGNATKDVLYGTTAVVAHREVVKNDNCNACHVTIQAHGGRYRDTAMCVLCHTAGAQDAGASVAGAVAGTLIEFKVMIHRIHNGAHLPSVNGVASDPTTGDRTYGGTPVSNVIVGRGGTLHDFSAVNSPVYPSFQSAMPRRAGYSALTGTQKTTEARILQGVVSCYKCHGDPDGSGPKTAPSQGNLSSNQPSRRACGSCHDDINWASPYKANGMTMPPQADDASCTTCHLPTGTTLAQGYAMTVGGAGTLAPTPFAHVHPLSDPKFVSGAETYNSGVNFNITAMSGSAASYFVAGEKPAITFTVKDDANVDIPLYQLSAISTTAAGPANNRQLIFPMNGPKSATVPVCDFTGRLVSTSTTNKGIMSRVVGSTASETLKVQFTSATAFTITAGSGLSARGGTALPASPSTNPSGSSVSAIELTNAVVQAITVNFSSATAFTVTGSVGGVMGSGTMPASVSASTRFTSTDGTVSFTLTSGTTAFASGNNIYLVVCQASTNGHLFAITAGRTAFAVGDRFYYETVNNSLTSYTFNLPMDMFLEFLGDGVTGTAGETFTAANLPVYWGRETVYERTVMATGGGAGDTTLTGAVSARGRYIDVTSVAGFANANYVVLDHGTAGSEEYLLIGTILGNRIWFTTPMRHAHVSGVTCKKVTLTQRFETTHYTLNPTTGTITTVTPVTATNALVISYRTDGAFGWKRFNGDAVQAVYPPPMNDSADLGQDWGEWQGLAFQNGTYTTAVWGSKLVYVPRNNEIQAYQLASLSATSNFLYGVAGTVTPYTPISSQNNCASCHDGLFFHGGSRKDNDTCVMCHGTAGCEDWPAYNGGGAALTTPGVTVSFRTMLHKIHMGEELTNASTYTIVGNGGNSSTFQEIVFPALPGKTKSCVSCHGTTNTAWKAPTTPVHAAQTTPVANWKAVCGSCHDSTDAANHITAMTTGGVETCTTCHGTGAAFSVETVHKNR